MYVETRQYDDDTHPMSYSLLKAGIIPVDALVVSIFTHHFIDRRLDVAYLALLWHVFVTSSLF